MNEKTFNIKLAKYLQAQEYQYEGKNYAPESWDKLTEKEKCRWLKIAKAVQIHVDTEKEYWEGEQHNKKLQEN